MEMERLKRMLDYHGIPYRSNQEPGYCEKLEYLDAETGKVVCSVDYDDWWYDDIDDEDLLGLTGLAFDEYAVPLYVEDIFRRIERHYKKMTTVYPEYVIIDGDMATFAPEVTSIPADAFEENNIIRKIIVPEGVEYVYGGGFKKCKNLEEISFPSTLKEIHGGCLEGTSIKRVSIGEGVEKIDIGAFENCKNLESVHIPGSVKTIEAFAFMDCSLREVILDDGVEKIEHMAFAGNPLEQVVIPKSVKKLDDTAFLDENGEQTCILLR